MANFSNATPASLPDPTDVDRWSDKRNLDEAWNARARHAADFFPAGAVVLDLGCGAMALEGFLPPGCIYLPCDLVARDQRTLLCNFNLEPIPRPQTATHVSMLGVLEYIQDWQGFLKQIRAFERPLVFSYCPTDFTAHLNRAELGWVNHFSIRDLANVLTEADLFIHSSARVDNLQMIIKATPGPQRLPITRKVLVLYNGPADAQRLQVLNSVIPADAEVQYADLSLGHLPEGEFHLLILGAGETLSPAALTDELMALMKRAKRTVGIFGLDRGHDLDRVRFAELLDKLTVWFARYEEDLLLFGNGRANVVHLGDWRLAALPGTARVFDDVAADQMPLFQVALTSAARLSYSGGTEFQALLNDVFGRTFPSGTPFEIDHESVAGYRQRVLRLVATLPQLLGELLR